MKQEHCIGTISSAGGLEIKHRTPRSLRLVEGLKGAAELWRVWLERARQRRCLSELSDHLLRDIGIDRAAARAEAQRRFWQP